MSLNMIHHVDIKAVLWQVSWDECVYHRWRLPLRAPLCQ